MLAKPSLLALLFATVTGAACTTTESDNILTRGMFASIRATADGSGDTTVSTSLFLGQPSDLIFIDLVGGDRLIAHQLASDRLFGTPWLGARNSLMVRAASSWYG
jgi:hypothetical protein